MMMVVVVVMMNMTDDEGIWNDTCGRKKRNVCS
jgi:hypothetical protein